MGEPGTWLCSRDLQFGPALHEYNTSGSRVNTLLWTVHPTYTGNRNGHPATNIKYFTIINTTYIQSKKRWLFSSYYVISVHVLELNVIQFSLFLAVIPPILLRPNAETVQDISRVMGVITGQLKYDG